MTVTQRVNNKTKRAEAFNLTDEGFQDATDPLLAGAVRIVATIDAGVLDTIYAYHTSDVSYKQFTTRLLQCYHDFERLCDLSDAIPSLWGKTKLQLIPDAARAKEYEEPSIRGQVNTDYWDMAYLIQSIDRPWLACSPRHDWVAPNKQHALERRFAKGMQPAPESAERIDPKKQNEWDLNHTHFGRLAPLDYFFAPTDPAAIEPKEGFYQLRTTREIEPNVLEGEYYQTTGFKTQLNPMSNSVAISVWGPKAPELALQVKRAVEREMQDAVFHQGQNYSSAGELRSMHVSNPRANLDMSDPYAPVPDLPSTYIHVKNVRDMMAQNHQVQSFAFQVASPVQLLDLKECIQDHAQRLVVEPRVHQLA